MTASLSHHSAWDLTIVIKKCFIIDTLLSSAIDSYSRLSSFRQSLILNFIKVIRCFKSVSSTSSFLYIIFYVKLKNRLKMAIRSCMTTASIKRIKRLFYGSFHFILTRKAALIILEQHFSTAFFVI